MSDKFPPPPRVLLHNLYTGRVREAPLIRVGKAHIVVGWPEFVSRVATFTLRRPKGAPAYFMNNHTGYLVREDAVTKALNLERPVSESPLL